VTCTAEEGALRPEKLTVIHHICHSEKVHESESPPYGLSAAAARRGSVRPHTHHLWKAALAQSRARLSCRDTTALWNSYLVPLAAAGTLVRLMMKLLLRLAAAAAAASLDTVIAAATPPALGAPQHLRVENLLPEHQTVVISEPEPRFAFHHAPLAAPAPFGVEQTSYRITVAVRGANTSLIWDSGGVASASTSEIVYGRIGQAASAPLHPFTRYTVCVAYTAWASSCGTLGTSPQACVPFETGPIVAADWQGAGWLVALARAQGRPKTDTQYRHTFSVPRSKTVDFARVYVAAAGCAHVEVNGAVPLPNMRGICPWPVKGATMHSVRYVTHRIGDDHEEDGSGSGSGSSGNGSGSGMPSGVTLAEENAIGVISGNVMDSPQLLMLLMIKFVGETQPFFLSSSSGGWLSTNSYVVSNSAWDTTIDWTLHEPGWSTAQFKPDPERWLPAALPVPANGTRAASARALAMPLSTVLEEVVPDSVQRLPGGDFLYRFPKNFVGTLRVKTGRTAAEAGASLIVLLGEWLVPTKPSVPVPLPPPPPPAPPPGPPSHCARVAEGRSLTLGCAKGSTIDRVVFASFGTPGGSCASGFEKWYAPSWAPHGLAGKICNSKMSVAVVEKACLGKQTCAVHANSATFGGDDPCDGVHKSLAAEVHCSGHAPGATCPGSCYDAGPPPAPAPAPAPPPHPPAPAPPGPAALCGIVEERQYLHLGCAAAGQTIDQIVFASFGTPTGTCDDGFRRGKDSNGTVCDSNASVPIVKSLCLGKTSCLIQAAVATHTDPDGPFKRDPCLDVRKGLAVEIHCVSLATSRIASRLVFKTLVFKTRCRHGADFAERGSTRSALHR
jgi:hypothetical protein